MMSCQDCGKFNILSIYNVYHFVWFNGINYGTFIRTFIDKLQWEYEELSINAEQFKCIQYAHTRYI